MDRDWEELKALKTQVRGVLETIKLWEKGDWNGDFKADNMTFCLEIEASIYDCREALEGFVGYMNDQTPNFEEEE